MGGSQDSGTCVFDYKADGDDDGFIDDFVQEQFSEVCFMSSLLQAYSETGVSITFGLGACVSQSKWRSL